MRQCHLISLNCWTSLEREVFMAEHDSTTPAASKLCANSQSEVITRTISIYALEFSVRAPPKSTGSSSKDAPRVERPKKVVSSFVGLAKDGRSSESLALECKVPKCPETHQSTPQCRTPVHARKGHWDCNWEEGEQPCEDEPDH